MSRNSGRSSSANSEISSYLGWNRNFSQMQLSELPLRLHEFDIVVSCTASTLPLIGLGAVERAVKLRKKKPMFMLDLAVPRDIEPEVKSLRDVYLYSVDDLSSVVQVGQAHRQAAVSQAESIIDVGVKNFHQWMEQRGNVPLIQQLHSKADAWREAELTKAKKLLAKGEDLEQVLETLSRGLVKKMMHGTMSELHAATSHDLQHMQLHNHHSIEGAHQQHQSHAHADLKQRQTQQTR
ncbi:MAG: hypothetical protein EB072_17325 [Betaproteobacteria bacterium]|nr:hypothetical protein [Betaproteobacteria bacterium]